MSRLFGTDGVRGVANQELTPEMALQLGRAGAYALTPPGAAHAPVILVGKDTRRSGGMLEAALTAGLCSLGATVYRAGVVPTPGIAYLVRKYRMDAGVMISASHNPMRDNGIKFFDGNGYKLPDALEDEIDELYRRGPEALPRPEGAGVGMIKDCPEASEDYAEYVLSTVPGLRLDGIKIALDCANGAASFVAPRLFELLGAETYLLHHKPDGLNINEDCGSTHMDSLQKYVTANHMQIGLAFDGDGDRMLAVDETGALVDGDAIMAICGLNLHKRGLLTHNALVCTVMSNLGLTLMCKKHGIDLHKTAVGDRYVLEKMLAEDYDLGGEQSGHIIFRRHNTTGDGLITGLQLLSVLRRENAPLSELKQVMEVMPQALAGAKVSNERKQHLVENEPVTRLIADIEARLEGEGRVLVRPSGTEPLIRVMIEGRDKQQVDEWADELAHLIARELG